MKNLFKILTLSLMFGMLSSCGEEEDALFNDKDAYFAFETVETEVVENDIRPIRIPVSLAKSVAMGEVSFEIVTEGLEYPAEEGVDFTIKNRNNIVEFNGELIQDIEIRLINNYERDGDKMFKIVLVSNNIDANIGLANMVKTEHLVTITDDEHPLARLIGYDFNVEEQSIAKLEDGSLIAPYKYGVELSPVSGSDNQLYVKGLLGIPQKIIFEFDIENATVEILPDQAVKDVYAYGWTSDLTFFGWEWYVKEDGSDGVRRFPSALGTFDLEKQEIILPDGYLAQITSPDTHPYVGFAYNIFIIDYCRIS